MTDNDSITEAKGKEPESSQADIFPTIGSWEDGTRRPSEAGLQHRILFAPDPRERIRRERTEDIAALTLTRTFSRQSRFSSYSTASDEEAARVRRVTSRKTVDLQTRLPTCTHCPSVCEWRQTYT
jgi:hypothetical protein